MRSPKISDAVVAAIYLVYWWAVIAFLSVLSMFVFTFVGSPRWLPLPWSEFVSFVEGSDGTVYIRLRAYARVLQYDSDGRFLASYPAPYPNSKTRGLASSEDGSIFFPGHDTVYEYSLDWTILNHHRSDGDSDGTWKLNEKGVPVSIPMNDEAMEVVYGVAYPGDIIFVGPTLPPRSRQERFVCSDESVLVKKGNHLERESKSGQVETYYRGLIIFWPFTFPFPLFWIFLIVLSLIFILDNSRIRRAFWGIGSFVSR